jgi:RNAse (barnase) inhibitor barstar
LELTVFAVDCDRARSRSAVLRAVVKAVDFPEFFGGDLDAFFDCLCDTIRDQKTGALLWFHKLHTGDPNLADDTAAIIAVCEDAAEFARNNDKIFVFAVEHAGKHPDPEPGVAPMPYYSDTREEA